MPSSAKLQTYLWATVSFLWSALEASVWWVAPDIAICIGYTYQERRWKLFLGLALLGALVGAAGTYLWASTNFAEWSAYVHSMPFHSDKNLLHARSTVGDLPWAIIKAAWMGVPYKLYFGMAAPEGISFWALALWGLLSRAFRFLFSLLVTLGLRRIMPWSHQHKHRFALLLLVIWCAMIYLFDAVINKSVTG